MRYLIFLSILIFVSGCAKKEGTIANIAKEEYTMNDVVYKLDALESRQNRKDDEIKALREEIKSQRESVERLDNLVRMQEVVAKRLSEAAKNQRELLEGIKEKKNEESKQNTQPAMRPEPKQKEDLKPKTVQKEEAQPKIAMEQKSGTVIDFTPTSFVLKRDATVYKSQEGQEAIEIWRAGKPFTAYQKSGTRIRVSGYFVDRKWSAAPQKMWIDEEAVEARR